MQKLKFILNNFYLLLILVDSYRCSELYKKTPRTNQNLVNKGYLSSRITNISWYTTLRPLLTTGEKIMISI